MSQTRIGALSRRERQRLIAFAIMRVALTTVILCALYALVPLGLIPDARAIVRLAIVVVLFVAMIVYQIRSIIRSDYPQLRAIEVTLTALVVFVIAFALLYLGLSESNPANFNEPLDRVMAFYFTVTVLSTVGFGDITPRTDPARLVVAIHMLLNLTFIAVLIRVFFFAARRRTQRQQARLRHQQRRVPVVHRHRRIR